jgi:hypothetical protein
MARFLIEQKINDGKNEAPPVTVDCEDLEEYLDAIAEFGSTDSGGFFGPGSTLNVTRLA